ncbi:uncharacterized protein G2W53_014300 [Senna tora]|uniref:Uncharacterized protein n=1 Tax=Senna tora TaxID=362788 RepID=A0A834WT92_9FABA|nr:uncharacterized protein G2W53_014300 [Senna tora]
MGGAWIMSQHILDDKSRSDLSNLHELRGKTLVAQEERGSCLNIFWTKNRGRITETFMNYEAKDLCASESNTSVRVVFANRSGFDAPIGVVLAWEERGSYLNTFQTTNRGRISKTFTNNEAKDLWRKSVDHVLTYSGGQIMVRSQKSSRIARVVLRWEERGSCLNIFQTTNRDRISKPLTNYDAKDLLRITSLVAQVSLTRRFALYLRTGVVLMLQLESSWHARSMDHVLTYSRQQIAVESQKPSRITRQKTCCASESNTSVRVVFAKRSDFEAPTGVFLAWEERGSCRNIFRTTNCGRISDTFTNYKAKDLLRK